jgi:uncharacterized membrane protein
MRIVGSPNPWRKGLSVIARLTGAGSANVREITAGLSRNEGMAAGHFLAVVDSGGGTEDSQKTQRVLRNPASPKKPSVSEGGHLSYYEFLKFVHILMAIVWVGGAIAVQVLAFRILKENNPQRLAALSSDVGALGERMFAPASIALVLVGILMVIDSGIEFSDTWIVIGIIGFLATLVTGLFYLTPTSKKLGGILEQRGPEDPEAQATIRRLLAVSRIDLLVLVIVVFNMVAKPGV